EVRLAPGPRLPVGCVPWDRRVGSGRYLLPAPGSRDRRPLPALRAADLPRVHGPRAGGHAVRRMRPGCPLAGDLRPAALRNRPSPAVYMASLLAGSLGALLVSPNQLTVGASGAIFGLLGTIIVGQRAAGISARASGMIPLLLINLVFTVAMPGISIGGHLGGLAGGFASGAIVFNRQLQRRHSAYALAGCVGIAVAC